MFEQIDAVIFDMDGTILDTENLCLYCWEKLAEEYKITNMRDIFIKCIGTNDVETKSIVLRCLGEDFDYDFFEKRVSEMFHDIINQSGIPMKKGVVEILETLKNKNILIGLASSSKIAAIERELKMAGIFEYFSAIVGGDELKKSKPEPDIYLMACEKMNVKPNRAYAVEDSYNGIRSAFSAGMKPIMVPDILLPNDEIKQKSAIIADNLIQLDKMFKN